MFTVLFVVLWIAVFWTVLFVLWPSRFFVHQPDHESPEAHEQRVAFEHKALQADMLKQSQKFTKEWESPGGAPTPKQLLGILNRLDTGLAENKTVVTLDDRNEFPGDHWLSRKRPLWFALFQAIPAAAIAVPLGWIIPSWGAALVCVVVVTIVLGFMSYELVPEKERLAVRRFRKNVNFLGTGLQFYLPWFEDAEYLTLKKIVWGPGQTPRQGSDQGDYSGHLLGSQGTAMNPSPGVFRVQFLGKWEFEIVVSIELQTYRQYRWAWYTALYEWDSIDEVGEWLGANVLTILQTRVREIEPKGQSTTDDPYLFVTSLLKLLDNIPEICADILIRLEEAELAGLLPAMVTLTSIKPLDDYLKLLQRQDQERVEGVAVAARRQVELDQLKAVPKEKESLVEEMERLSKVGQFAKNPDSAATAISAGLAQIASNIRK